jgi:hypothetical protein
VYYAPELDVEFHFLLDGHGKATAMTVADLSNITPWVRANLPPPSMAAQPVFVRGTMNRWSTTSALSRGSDGLFRATIDLPAGAQEFKIGSADWNAVDLGARNMAKSAEGYDSLALRAASDNIPLKVARPSRCVFTVDARDIVAPLLSVNCRTAP